MQWHKVQVRKTKPSRDDSLEDALRLELFHMAYRKAKDADSTVRFVRAIVTSSGPMDKRLCKKFMEMRKRTRGLPREEREAAFLEMCHKVKINRRSCWGGKEPT